MVNLYLNLFFLYCNLVFPSNTEVTSGIIILLSEKHLNVVLLFCLWWVLPITVHLKMYSFSLYSWRIFFQKKIHIASYFCLYFKTLLVWFLTPIISVEKFTVLLKVLPWFIQFFLFYLIMVHIAMIVVLFILFWVYCVIWVCGLIAASNLTKLHNLFIFWISIILFIFSFWDHITFSYFSFQSFQISLKFQPFIFHWTLKDCFLKVYTW